MDRRDFSRAAAFFATLGPGAVGLSQTAAPSPDSARSGKSAAATRRPAFGTNLSGMEWAKPGLRYGLSSEPNLHFTVPRRADIAYLASCGLRKSRLPIQWELLQPMLHDTQANEAARKLIGEPGAFNPTYEAYITAVLDAHAAVGMTCILDNHNYCRYQDFRFQPDGSIAGLTPAPNPLMRPYTSDSSQVQIRIFALAPGATLTVANFTDFWTRAARKWKGHPGFAGYGLMNEPHEMPRRGELVSSRDRPGRGDEDLTIWPAYAQAAVDAIRRVDVDTPIYVAGNEWSSATSIGTKNPGFPLKGDKLIYEVHLYLDANNTGATFDYATEAAKSHTAGLGRGGIKPSTGLDRLKVATQWAKTKNVALALTEIGMPIDDPRWEVMFTQTVRHALESDCEVFTWMGGNHWPMRSHPINQVPGWHQNKTLEPLVSGALKQAAGVAQASLFDDAPGYVREGQPLTVTVYARGNLAEPVTIAVAGDAKGSLSKAKLTLAAGANSQDSFTFTPGAAQLATLRYSLAAGAKHGELAMPPERRIYSLADPVAHAAVNLQQAAAALIGKYSACKWDMADAHTDYVAGAPASAGQPVRALADSGYGSSPGNAMEMLNFMNHDSPSMGAMLLPVLRVNQGRKSCEFRGENTFGLWCKKSSSVPVIQPNPVARVPYHIEDAHFVLAAVSVASSSSTGVVFQASKAEAAYVSELGFSNGAPTVRWLDSKGQKVQLTAPERLPANVPAVLTYVSTSGSQRLRVNGDDKGSASASFAPSPCSQMLIGWGFASYYPQPSFGGQVYAVITGKGSPSAAELAVLERYLAQLAGVRLG